MKYILELEPEPCARPRWGNGHVYDTQQLLKSVMALTIAKQHGDRKPFTGALAIYIKFYLTPPPGKKNKLRLGKPMIYKPDIDNLEKLLLDALARSRIIKDDCIICELHSKKVYDPKGRTVFEIVELLDQNAETDENKKDSIKQNTTKK